MGETAAEYFDRVAWLRPPCADSVLATEVKNGGETVSFFFFNVYLYFTAYKHYYHRFCALQ